jgi:transcription initiation factor IIE alpha subunit
MESKESIMVFMEMYCVGKENACTGEQMSKLSGIKIKTIQKDIRELRNSGAIICACDSSNRKTGAVNGYFIPANYDEGKEFLRVILKRALSTIKTYKKTKKSLLDKYFPTTQEKMEGLK